MRLRLAVSIGVLGVALSLAPAPGAAQGLLDFLFGPDPTAQQAPPSPRDSAPGRRARAQGTGSVGPRVGGSGLASDPRVGGFCVRACDGFFFPLIKATRATRQQSCELACPAAAMDVYDGATIESARNRKGQRYSAQPHAFAFRDRASSDCLCNDPKTSQANAERAAKDDPTLQNGDILVETNGAFVYSGSKLVPLGVAAMSSNLRNRVRALLPRSPAPAPTLAGTVEPAPPELEMSKDEPTGSTAVRQATP